MATQLEYEVLDDESVEDALDSLNGWESDQRAIHKTYSFNSFLEAIAFVNRVAVVAESLDHHPDIHINYKDVTLRCWTHKNNAITKADITLAHEIEKVA
jgi:4a-hydroxytetrahydrobiopterin dehydratase